MTTIIILFFMGYAFHWGYKGIDKIIVLLVEAKRKREEK